MRGEGGGSRLLACALPVSRVVDDALHPDLRRVARWLLRGAISPRTLRPVRIGTGLLARIPKRGVVVQTLGPTSVRVHQPTTSDQPRPALLWVHGGGYVIGTAAHDDRTAARTDIDESNFRLWNNTSNRFGWQSYTGYPPGSVEVSGLAAPSRYDDLSGLPPAWIGVGTLDLFHDEDLAYESRLQEAGVNCELEIVQGAFHGFDIVRPNAGVSQAFRFSQMAALASALT